MTGYAVKCAAAILGSAALLAVVTLAPRPDRQLALMFPPWVDDATAAARVWQAGGFVLSHDGPAMIARGGSNDFFTIIREMGVVLILDAERLALLCGSETGEERDG